MRQLSFSQNVAFGGDPEFSFKVKGVNRKIAIGSEKVLPTDGISSLGQPACKVILDGFNAELAFAPTNCRGYAANNISGCFKALRSNMTNKNIDVDFSGVVKVSKKEMASLSEKSRQFGCLPSFNVDDGEVKIKVNPETYLYRGSGGHVHLSRYGTGMEAETAIRNPKLLVPVLDAILGNVSVLLDRNPLQVERRKNYGAAGSFRTPTHGLEYRTLSNFWLKGVPLASFVFGMCRMAVHIASQSTTQNDYVGMINSLVPREKIVRAIQENNFNLAYENFKKLEDLIVEITAGANESYPINPTTIKEFHYFVKKGIDHWFQVDPLDAWTTKFVEGHSPLHGIENFLKNKVREEMMAGARQTKDINQIWQNI